MAETITANIKNCFDDETEEKEFVVNRQDGTELCRFKARQLTIYQFGRLKSDDPEAFNTNLIKAGVRWLKIGSQDWPYPLPDEIVDKLSRGKLDGGGGLVSGLFDVMASAVLGLNTLSEGEAKNSERRLPGN